MRTHLQLELAATRIVPRCLKRLNYKREPETLVPRWQKRVAFTMKWTQLPLQMVCLLSVTTYWRLRGATSHLRSRDTWASFRTTKGGWITDWHSLRASCHQVHKTSKRLVWPRRLICVHRHQENSHLRWMKLQARFHHTRQMRRSLNRFYTRQSSRPPRDVLSRHLAFLSYQGLRLLTLLVLEPRQEKTTRSRCKCSKLMMMNSEDNECIIKRVRVYM